jgi:hypothetical protein
MSNHLPAFFISHKPAIPKEKKIARRIWTEEKLKSGKWKVDSEKWKMDNQKLDMRKKEVSLSE